MGFEIERSIDKTDWRIIGFKEGNGTTTEPHHYSYSDDISEIATSKLYYRLKQIDFNGSLNILMLLEVEITPSTFSFNQNYPNPFNPVTTINYQIPNDGFVTLKVFDILGKEIANLVNHNKEAGYYTVAFDASKLPSGVYIYILQSGEFVSSKKMLLIK